jgi:hypothetical protein
MVFTGHDTSYIEKVYAIYSVVDLLGRIGHSIVLLLLRISIFIGNRS